MLPFNKWQYLMIYFNLELLLVNPPSFWRQVGSRFAFSFCDCSFWILESTKINTTSVRCHLFHVLHFDRFSCLGTFVKKGIWLWCPVDGVLILFWKEKKKQKMQLNFYNFMGEYTPWVTAFHFCLKGCLPVISPMCRSRKYPCSPQGRSFVLHPSPRKFQFSLILFF